MIATLLALLSLASTVGAGLAGGGAATARPRPLWLALVVNLTVVPAIAWAGARGLGLGAAGAGLVVTAAAPGGSTGPLLATLARGDARIAAALFVRATIAGSATALAATLAYDVASVAQVARAAALVTAIGVGPLLLGQVAQRRWPAAAARVVPWLSRAGAVLLVAVVIAIVATRRSTVAPLPVWGLSLAIVLASMAPALAVAERGARLAIAQVAAVRNLTLALVVLTAVHAPAAAIGATLVFGLVMYLVTAALALVARRLPP